MTALTMASADMASAQMACAHTASAQIGPGLMTEGQQKAADLAHDRAQAATPPPFDEAAFERFHARTTRSLWAYIHRMTGDPAVADDVHQESYLRFLARPCLESGERRQSAYLFRIATNLVRDRWRRTKRERSWLDRFRGSGSEVTDSSPVQERLDVTSVLDQLDPRQRALLWLAYVEGRSHAEIAEILDLKAASVRVLLFRARRRMASLLAKYGLTETEIRGE